MVFIVIIIICQTIFNWIIPTVFLICSLYWVLHITNHFPGWSNRKYSERWEGGVQLPNGQMRQSIVTLPSGFTLMQTMMIWSKCALERFCLHWQHLWQNSIWIYLEFGILCLHKIKSWYSFSSSSGRALNSNPALPRGGRPENLIPATLRDTRPAWVTTILYN